MESSIFEDTLFLTSGDLYDIFILCMDPNSNLVCKKCPLNSSKDNKGICVAHKAYKKFKQNKGMWVSTYIILIDNISDPDIKNLAIRWKDDISCFPWYNNG